MKKLLFLLIAFAPFTVTGQNTTKLAVPFRISFWLETPLGFEEYGKPNQFLIFNSVNDTQEMQNLYNGLTWLYMKLYKQTSTPKPATYLFIKQVTGGTAAAIYTYPAPNLQNETDLATLQNNILTTIQRWCVAFGQKSNAPVYQSSLPPLDPQYNDERYIVQTIDTK